MENEILTGQSLPINVQLSGQQKAVQTQWATSVPLQSHRNVGIWSESCGNPSFHKVLENSRIRSEASLLSPDSKLPSWLSVMELSYNEREDGGRRWLLAAQPLCPSREL